jgi:hypothetical protein
MITIFCDFSQFSAKKLAFFSQKQCYDHFFSKFSFVLSQKRQVFARFFGENNLIIITSVPGNYFFFLKQTLQFHNRPWLRDDWSAAPHVDQKIAGLNLRRGPKALSINALPCWICDLIYIMHMLSG